jgi:hypothetical protein
MSLPLLRDDALTTDVDGLVLRLCLPWIRSLPLSSVHDLTVTLDGEAVDAVVVLSGGRRVAAADVSAEDGWWFVQDRLAVHLPSVASAASHRVDVSFQLAVPYLMAGPDGPLTLPFAASRMLGVDAPSAPTVARDVA